jgi:flagellar basal-body rod modification protein FlgD
MSRIPSVAQFGPAPRGQGTDLRDVELDKFMDLLIAELQNQDPLNPLDNAQILQQIGQIREIGATNQLTETLDAVLTGQNLATASGLIGKQVSALTDSNENVQGVVDRVSIDTGDDNKGKRTLRVHIGDQSIKLDNIRAVAGQVVTGG